MKTGSEITTTGSEAYSVQPLNNNLIICIYVHTGPISIPDWLSSYFQRKVAMTG